MSDDLIEQLRFYDNIFVCARAADRLETYEKRIAKLGAELAEMRRCFEVADAERRQLRERAERAEDERDALRAALELYRGQVDQTGRHSAAEAIERASTRTAI